MEEGHFVKCEIEWKPDTEESSKFEQGVQLPHANLLEVKVEPYLKSDGRGDDADNSYSINEELIIEDVKEEPSDDDLDSRTFPNGKQSLLYLAITQGTKATSFESTRECSNNSKEHKDSLNTSCLRDESNEPNEVQKNKHKKKTLPCDACEKIFRDACDLARHSLIHSGEKPFVCNTCSKTFRQKGKLKDHLMVHSSEKPHVCTTCGKAFKRKDVLRTHIMRHKGDKCFVCPMCGRAFISAFVLKTHLTRHKGEKPHLCPTCTQGFNNPYVLKIHMITHSKDNKGCT